MKQTKQPHLVVEVGVMVLKGNQILLGKRKGSHGAGEYSFCSGGLEYMEGFEECALREIREECGIKVHNLRFQVLANVTEYRPKHHIQIGFVADWKSGTPIVLEPDKCESWGWYDINNLPRPLSKTADNILKSYETKRHCLDKNEEK